MTLLKSVLSGGGPKTSHSHVVNGLGLAIVGGTYAVGDVLPGDQDLGEKFGVSRSVLREAMKTLAAKGMVVPRTRIGTRVTDKRLWNYLDADLLKWHFELGVDENFIRHLYEMRLALEPSAARLAAQNREDGDAAAILALADRMLEPHTTESFALVDLEFHRAVFEATKNPLLHCTGNVIEAVLMNVLQNSSPASDPAETVRVAGRHRALGEAIEARDDDAAEAAMRVVIMHGWRGGPEAT
ncbi:FadR/GntR family transcriptional regulator [Acuticoccus sp. MNP-M23]|uniref:FadR/GntR family transcriptional regulator n=1 Tax=Acuticoccus sp. MNP-M23 TaxID=3072793 RepID=UPI0028159F65|nr:FadR/GntR family transcriptional regulator [Acuticoccus sp. MNP-M23]WMS42558.1 FadR/GntR family transcriptional regulator [Acuticoccus sp. MNP-M23]